LLCIQRADLRQNGREVFLLHTLPLTEIYPYSINYATRAKIFDKNWLRDYFLPGGDMVKRIADWLEKISAGSMLIGLYQGNAVATLFGLALFCVVLVLQRRLSL
ncbi:MAG: hypothetical protein LBC94_09660, partial [Desulfovibrio sp.]|jgi:hypothetical protein|nr:hypothetical protein [Desulfovibrio sp.]